MKKPGVHKALKTSPFCDAILYRKPKPRQARDKHIGKRVECKDVFPAGGVILGMGGDTSPGGQGTFFEGVLTKGYSTDAADDALQERNATLFEPFTYI